jgi:hypothetical protein
MERKDIAAASFIAALTIGGLTACGEKSATVLTEGCRPMSTPTPITAPKGSERIIDQRPLCTPVTLEASVVQTVPFSPTNTPSTPKSETTVIPTVTPDDQEKATETAIALTPSATSTPMPKKPTPTSSN